MPVSLPCPTSQPRRRSRRRGGAASGRGQEGEPRSPARQDAAQDGEATDPASPRDRPTTPRTEQPAAAPTPKSRPQRLSCPSSSSRAARVPAASCRIVLDDLGRRLRGRAGVERRLGVVLDQQLDRLREVVARDLRRERRAPMSMPDETPAAVITLPCSTTRRPVGAAPNSLERLELEPVRGRLEPVEHAGGAEQQRAGADRRRPLRVLVRVPDPAEDPLVVEQRARAPAAGHARSRRARGCPRARRPRASRGARCRCARARPRSRRRSAPSRAAARAPRRGRPRRAR